MNPENLLHKKEEQQERLQAIFRENEGDCAAWLAAVRDLLDEASEEYSRTVEDLRRENTTLREQAEECQRRHRHESREALEQVRTYAEELAAANEELRLTNEELHQINETLTAQKEELIAARRTAETERRRYYDLFDAAPDGYLETDPDGTIREANRAASLLLAVHKESLQDRNLVHFIGEGSREEFRSHIARAADGKPQQDVELRLRPLEGEPVCVSVSIAAVRLEEAAAPSLRWMVRDITERKRAEKALIRRTEDLVRQSRKLEAARDEANIYLDIMTHDVRNANNVSSMYADLLMELVGGNVKPHVEKLHDSIERSSEILQNVATLRRVQQEPGRLVPVNLDAVIREEVAGFPDAAIRYDGTPVSVLADSLLPVIVTNLVGNAVKFGGPDATVTVRVEERGREVLVSVEDTGPGVPDEVKERLFTRFERGRASGRGQGLGLFIVRTLVERYGGRIWVEDRACGRPEEGAAFRFTLKTAAPQG